MPPPPPPHNIRRTNNWKVGYIPYYVYTNENYLGDAAVKMTQCDANETRRWDMTIGCLSKICHLCPAATWGGGGVVGLPVPNVRNFSRIDKKKWRIFTATKAIYFPSPIPSNNYIWTGQIFWALAVELFGRSGRKKLQRVGSTVPVIRGWLRRLECRFLLYLCNVRSIKATKLNLGTRGGKEK